MKLDPQFKSQSNKLFFLSGTEFNAKESLNVSSENLAASNFEASKLLCISVLWSQIGFDEENYNENFLASLRDNLKSFEEKKIYAFILPVADKIPESELEKENFTASFKHCARRIKDCTSVVGFAVPDCINQQNFIEELSAKHKHYIFFSKNPQILKNEAIVEF